jgi:hypothetical protein
MVSPSFQRVSAVIISRPRSGSDFEEMYVGVALPHPMGKGFFSASAQNHGKAELVVWNMNNG